jgi:hypothetical protein
MVAHKNVPKLDLSSLAVSVEVPSVLQMITLSEIELP